MRPRTASLPLAALLVVLLTVTPASASGSASAVRFPTANGHQGEYQNGTGCEKVVTATPKYAAQTGVLRWGANASARICPHATPAWMNLSLAQASTNWTFRVPLTVATGTRGVNLSWAISAVVNESAFPSASASCPERVTVGNVSVSAGGYEVVKEISRICQYGASAGLAIYPYLWDLTTHRPVHASSGPAGTGGDLWFSQWDYHIWWNFTNPSLWQYNSTSNGSYLGGGGGPANVNATASGTWYFNASFNSSDRYVIGVYASASVRAYITGYTHGQVCGRIDLFRAGRAAAVESITVW